MAIITKTLATYNNGAAQLYFTYDDQTMTIQTIDAINNDDKTYTLTAVRQDNGQTYQFSLASGNEVHQNVPQSQALKLGLSVVTGGKLAGVTWAVDSQKV